LRACRTRCTQCVRNSNCRRLFAGLASSVCNSGVTLSLLERRS
jgi:hypothetical protein